MKSMESSTEVQEKRLWREKRRLVTRLDRLRHFRAKEGGNRVADFCRGGERVKPHEQHRRRNVFISEMESKRESQTQNCNDRELGLGVASKAPLRHA